MREKGGVVGNQKGNETKKPKKSTFKKGGRTKGGRDLKNNITRNLGDCKVCQPTHLTPKESTQDEYHAARKHITRNAQHANMQTRNAAHKPTRN